MNMSIIKKLVSVVLFAAVCASLCACGSQQESKQSTGSAPETTETQTGSVAPREKRKVIIDTDTGADDASALILAAKQEKVDILGVTVLVGNVSMEQSTKNALAALEIAGCDAPVYKCSESTFDGTEKTAFSVFGTDGMGDADLIHPKKQAEKSDAVDFIIDTVKSNPGEVEIIVLGPGNASPVAEFNVYADPQAYKLMLDSNLPITVIGLDMCNGEAMWTDEQFKELESLNDTGRFVAKSFGKIRKFYKGNGSETVMNCDSLAVMCMLYPGFVKNTVNTHASCITEKGETYSQVIFYKEGFTYDIVKNEFEHNTVLVTEADKSAYFKNYLDAIK